MKNPAPIFLLQFLTLTSTHAASPYAPRASTGSETQNRAVYHYGNAGNRLSNGLGQSVEVGLTGKPIIIKQGNESTVFKYDTGNNTYVRVNSDGSKTLYVDGGSIEYRLPATGTANASAKSIVHIKTGGYSPKLQVDTSDASNLKYTFLLSDSLGSSLCAVSDSGDVISRRRFEPWGQIVSSSGVSKDLSNEDELFRGFTGHETIAAFDLIHMKGRIYDPEINSFLAPDKVFGKSIPGLNRYSYVANSPVNGTDPSGWAVEFTRGSERLFRARFMNPLPEHLAERFPAQANHRQILSRLIGVADQSSDLHLEINMNRRGDVEILANNRTLKFQRKQLRKIYRDRNRSGIWTGIRNALGRQNRLGNAFEEFYERSIVQHTHEFIMQELGITEETQSVVVADVEREISAMESLLLNDPNYSNLFPTASYGDAEGNLTGQPNIAIARSSSGEHPHLPVVDAVPSPQLSRAQRARTGDTGPSLMPLGVEPLPFFYSESFSSDSNSSIQSATTF